MAAEQQLQRGQCRPRGLRVQWPHLVTLFKELWSNYQHTQRASCMRGMVIIATVVQQVGNDKALPGVHYAGMLVIQLCNREAGTQSHACRMQGHGLVFGSLVGLAVPYCIVPRNHMRKNACVRQQHACGESVVGMSAAYEAHAESVWRVDKALPCHVPT